MGNSFVVGSNERSANFHEVLELTMSINCRSSGLRAKSSEAISIDFEHSFLRDLGTFTASLLLLLKSAVEISPELIFDSLLTASSNSLVFSILLDAPILDNFVLVDNVVHHELIRMSVLGNELKLSVSLISESALTTGLQQVSRCLASQRNTETGSQSEDGQLLKLSVTIEILLDVSAEVSIGLVNLV